MLPLYEAKMIHHYDHRWATYERDGTVRDVTLEEKHDPDFVVMPRYWVDEKEVDAKLPRRWDRDWLLGWRDICRSTDERTCIATLFLRSAVGNSIPVILSARRDRETQSLQPLMSAFVVDYALAEARWDESSTFSLFAASGACTVAHGRRQ